MEIIWIEFNAYEFVVTSKLKTTSFGYKEKYKVFSHEYIKQAAFIHRIDSNLLFLWQYCRLFCEE